MPEKSIEGVWEDVASRGRELAGRRVRVIVLDEPDTPTNAIPGHLLDHDAVDSCRREADFEITLEEVRASTSSIRSSMAKLVIDEDRADRS